MMVRVTPPKDVGSATPAVADAVVLVKPVPKTEMIVLGASTPEASNDAAFTTRIDCAIAGCITRRKKRHTSVIFFMVILIPLQVKSATCDADTKETQFEFQKPSYTR